MTLTMCEGTKSSPWEGRINYGGVSVIYLYPLIFLWSLTSHMPCTVTSRKLSANEVAIDGVGMRIIHGLNIQTKAPSSLRI